MNSLPITLDFTYIFKVVLKAEWGWVRRGKQSIWILLEYTCLSLTTDLVNQNEKKKGKASLDKFAQWFQTFTLWRYPTIRNQQVCEIWIFTEDYDKIQILNSVPSFYIKTPECLKCTKINIFNVCLLINAAHKYLLCGYRPSAGGSVSYPDSPGTS